jgi:hypothetical protein
MIAIIRFGAFALSTTAIFQYFLGAEMADWLFSAILSIILRLDALGEGKE